MVATEASDSTYESARNQRVEENKKRLHELGLTDLSRDLTKSATPTKCSPSPRQGRPRVLKEKVKVQLRRSTRNTDGPQPDYVEVEIDIRRRARFDNTGGTRHYSRLYKRKYASDEARACATDKADALKKQLPQTNASFVKPMLQSHVTGGFWLGLPVAFCRDHLPKRDDRIVLEDENNEEWETIYLSNKTGLSGGWRGFSLDHGLVDGDALVFELVEPRRFKVHIVRVYGWNANSNEEEQQPQAVEEQGPKSAEKGGGNKVRQRLTWLTEHEKGHEIKEETGHDATEAKCDIGKVEGINKQKDRSDDGADDGYDIKPDVHLAQHSGIIQKEMECDAGIEDAKNVDILDFKAQENQRPGMSFKRLKNSAGLDVNLTVKDEMQTGDDDDGFEDVKDVVRLFDSKSSNMYAKDITSYMRSKKHLDVNVKKEIQSGNEHVKVC